MLLFKKIFSIGCFLLVFSNIHAQLDSLDAKKNVSIKKADSGKVYRPKVATIRSAILPGWGQLTNKKYWKLPIVFGAIGISTGVFIHNIKQYKTVKNAYINATDGNPLNDYLIPDTYYAVRNSPEVIRSFRNQVRQNVDYAALFILFFWGLNVVDATVDAHLKTFDVSPDLSLHLKLGHSNLAATDGISVVLPIGKQTKSK
jgi:hypothetical protein